MSQRKPESRDVALQVLKAVRTDDAYANLLLPEAIRAAGLDSRDAGLATELTYGTLRWQGLYDAIAQQCIDREWSAVDPDLIDVLRLGIHQLLHMRVPAHAAVDTSCELAKRVGAPGGAKGRVGFVNAVLRKVTQRDLVQWQAEFDEATAMSHPAWIVRAYRDALGERRDELHDLLAANNEPSRPSLVARPGRITTEAMIRHPDIDPGRWSPLAGTLLRGAPDEISTVRDGAVGVQDEGSQLVALALARVPITGPDRAWLDMCAGPGGKAVILAGLAQESGAQLTAVDIHPHRAELVSASLTTSRVLVGDARQRPWGDVTFDRVLVDAPCTGIGALRRRPDARWRRSPADVTQLGPLQRELLQTALDVVRPGGVVAYVTCSPHLVETEDVVHACTRKRTDVTMLDAGEYLPELPDARVGPFVQMWPHRHGTDGMFLALLRRDS